MTTQADLERVRGIRFKLERLADKRLRLRESVQRLRAPVMSDMPRGGRRTDPMLEYIVRLEEVELRYAALMVQLEERLVTIEEDLDHLDPRHAEVLRLRYCECMGWRRVAFRMHYSERWVKALHDKALDELRKCAC